MKKIFIYVPLALYIIILLLFAGCGSSNIENSDADKLTNETSALASSTSETTPEDKNGISDTMPDDRDIQTGEILMTGSANYSQADNFSVSFIMSEDKQQIRDIRIIIKNLSLSAVSGSTEVNINSGNVNMTYIGSYDVTDGEIDIDFAEGCQLSLTVSEDTAEGLIGFTYIVQPLSSLGSQSQSIPVDMGTQPIIFSSDTTF